MYVPTRIWKWRKKAARKCLTEGFPMRNWNKLNIIHNFFSILSLSLYSCFIRLELKQQKNETKNRVQPYEKGKREWKKKIKHTLTMLNNIKMFSFLFLFHSFERCPCTVYIEAICYAVICVESSFHCISLFSCRI